MIQYVLAGNRGPALDIACAGSPDADFRVWHFWDMPTASHNVRCWGKTGSAQRMAKTTLLTLSRHFPVAVFYRASKL